MLDFLKLPSISSSWLYGLSIVLPVSGAVVLCLSHLRQSIAWPGEAPVRWSWLPFIGYALEMGKRPIELLQECAEMFDGVYGIVVGGNRMFFITDCHSTDVILKPCKSLTWKEFHTSILVNFFNVKPASYTDDVVDEELMRKYYTQYLLSDKYLHKLTERMESQMYKNISMVKEGVLPLYDTIGRFIFNASLAAMFNESITNFDELFEGFRDFDSCMAFAAAGIHTNNFPKAAKGRDLLGQLAATNTENISTFMQRRHDYLINIENQGKMFPGDTARLQVALLWASVGNTMPGTFWVLYNLITHPEALAKAHKEIKSFYPQLYTSGEFEKVAPPYFKQDILNQMLYLDSCITETLRLSSGSLIMRICSEPCTLTLANGKAYKFRKGDRVGLCPPLFHLDNEIFPNAKSFSPDRWYEHAIANPALTPEEKTLIVCGKIPMRKDGVDLPPAATFLPFGAGITYCPGRRFARNEIKILLVFLLTQYDFSIPKEYQGKVQASPVIDPARAGLGIFPPKIDIMAEVKCRKVKNY